MEKHFYESIKAMCDYIKSRVSIRPNVGIVCGSGLGILCNSVADKEVVPYTDIPDFPQSTGKHISNRDNMVTVIGHAGNLVFGKLGGKEVVLMQGRFHPYEGYSACETGIPIRVMKLLGVETLFITNASGGLTAHLNVGDIVVIRDHIHLHGLCGGNPLIGKNDDKFGTRFPPMSDAYDLNLRALAKQVAKELGCAGLMHEGVYFMAGGPSYETAAESKMIALIGADVVGMSTVPEVIVARHAGIRVFCASLVTNKSVKDPNDLEVANHEEVLMVGKSRAETIVKLFTEMITRL